LSDKVSIRMGDSVSSAPPMDLFATRPDKKGPKTIAIILILGSIIFILIGIGDIQNSMRDDFPDAELEPILENYENLEVNVTGEQYQEYHDVVRSDGAYSVRGYSMVVGGLMVIVGSILVFRLNIVGVYISIIGTIIGLIGGFMGSWMMVEISNDMLPDKVTETSELLSYVCGSFWLCCAAMALLPIINASARAALDQRVQLVIEEE
jgi:hypothetical protein